MGVTNYKVVSYGVVDLAADGGVAVSDSRGPRLTGLRVLPREGDSCLFSLGAGKSTGPGPL